MVQVDSAALQKLLLAARQCLKASQPDRALELLDAVLKLDGSNALALFVAGSAHVARSEHAAAAAAFRRATALTAGAQPGSSRHQLHITATENLLLEAERVLPPSWVPALHDSTRLAALQAGITVAVAAASGAAPTTEAEAEAVSGGAPEPAESQPGCRVLVVGGIGVEAVLAAQAGAGAVVVYCPANQLAAELAAELAADSGCQPGTVATATSAQQLDTQGGQPFDLLVLADALGPAVNWQLLQRQLADVRPLLSHAAAVVPHALRIRGQLVECPAAVALNQVDVALLHADTGGLDLAPANCLLPRSSRSMHLPTQPHTALTPAATLLSVPLASLLPPACANNSAGSPETSGADCCHISSTGSTDPSAPTPAAAAAAAACGGSVSLPVTSSGAAHALAWWFEQQLLPAGASLANSGGGAPAPAGAAPVLSADPQGWTPQDAQLHPHVWQHLRYLDQRQLAPGQAVQVGCSLLWHAEQPAMCSSTQGLPAGTGAVSKALQKMSELSLSPDASRGAAPAAAVAAPAPAPSLCFQVTLASGASLLLPVSAEQAAIAAAVPRYHTAMLNDSVRTAAYRDGIAAAMQQAADKAQAAAGRCGGSEPLLVLEIGSGSGLLCLLACQAGARHIIGCERLLELQEAAAQLLTANGVAERVTILPKHSKELTVAAEGAPGGPGGAAGAAGTAETAQKADLPRRADVLMHEIFGSDPLSEGVVPSLLHAKQHLLAPGAVLAPCKLRIVAAVAASTSKHRLLRPPASVCGGAVVTRALRQLAPRKVDCRAGEAGSLVLLTEPAPVLELAFARPELGMADSATVLLECLPSPKPMAQWMAEQAGQAEQAGGAVGTAAVPGKAAGQSSSSSSTGWHTPAAASAPTPASASDPPSLFAVSWFEYEFPGGCTASTAPHIQRTEHWQQVVHPLEGEAVEAVLEELRGAAGSSGGSSSDGGSGSIGHNSCSSSGSSQGGASRALLLTAGYRVDRLWFELAGVATVVEGSDSESEGGRESEGEDDGAKGEGSQAGDEK